MARLTAEKLEQAGRMLAASDIDLWMVFVRETAEGGDPVLPLIVEGGLTWESALLVTREGRRIALVGNYDADPLRSSGDWHEVVPYVHGMGQVLRETLDRLLPECDRKLRIGINFSVDDPKCDGITHGMKLRLDGILKGTRFEGCLVSAEGIVRSVRGRKSAEEIARIRRAVRETQRIFREMPEIARLGWSEREVFDRVQELAESRGFGFSWDRHGDPIVNSGPDSMIGHGIPSEVIRIAPGHLFHIDLGLLADGYASDLQRTWYVARPGGEPVPEDVLRAFHAVHGSISAGAETLRPGIEGWRVDEAGRRFIVEAGYPEYQHALGHQVGRVAHDGGALLGPRWERYGKTPDLLVEPGQVFTLELGVVVEGRGYLGIEEMVLVTESGVEWLSQRQEEVGIIV